MSYIIFFIQLWIFQLFNETTTIEGHRLKLSKKERDHQFYENAKQERICENRIFQLTNEYDFL